MYRPFLLVLLAGCAVDNTLSVKDKDRGIDTGEITDEPDTDREDHEDTSPDDTEFECPELEVGTPADVTILTECTGTTTTEVTDPWNATIEYQYTSAGSGVIVMPAVGNLNDDNGDGVVDEYDVPEIVFTTWYSNTLVALDGATGAVLFEVGGYDGQAGVTIADLDDDGDPEIAAVQTGYRIAAVDASGRAEWVSTSFPMQPYPQPTVADLDNDGMPEVIADVGVVNGENGSTVATLAGDSSTYHTPIAADLDQDGRQEIILGNRVYDANGAILWTSPGSGWATFGAVADVDGDPEGEVFFVSGGTAYLYEAGGRLITSFTIPGGSNPGPPCMADFDGDGEVEIAIPNSTQISVFNVDGTRLWSSTMQDNSGIAGCSGYDVNGDGAYEVLFADEIAFRIYDGATGAIHYDNRNHASLTVWEYPVIADVDNDGSAEIVVADNAGRWQGITVYGHSGDGWPKSGTTWATHDFAVTNIEPDGHVPSPPDASWQVHNVFRARPSVDDPSSADLLGSITDVCVADCELGPVKLAFQVTNQGGADVPAGALASIYAADGGGTHRYITSVTLPEVPAGRMIRGIEVELTAADVGRNGFILKVDDEGTGVGVVGECDEGNNQADYRDGGCP